MPNYPETPLDLVIQAVEEAKAKGASAGLIDPVPDLVAKGQWQVAQSSIDEASHKNPDACGNLRTKLSWARQWSHGQLPGVMGVDLGVTGDPDSVKDAWMEIISGGKYKREEPPITGDKVEFESRVKETERRETEAKAKAKKEAQTGPSTEPKAEVVPVDDYSDIQQAIKEGKL